jgi:hypothetical protein
MESEPSDCVCAPCCPVDARHQCMRGTCEAMAYPDEARAGPRRVIGREVTSPAMNELPP